MARIAYEDWQPTGKSLSIVQIASSICAEYAAQGYDLTLRQLYYQFVARDYLPNNQRSYKNLGVTIDRARKAGLLDWDYITDRTRNLRGFHTVDTPGELISEQEAAYFIDLWQDQERRVEVWVEKEALAGVVARSAGRYSADFFSCRGYVSQSELHAAALRHRHYQAQGQRVTVIHLGDHDPSGIDMTRDIEDRLTMFGAATIVDRIALNRDQIDEFNPPPNPAKLTDSRARGYIDEHGASSWELDALDPDTLDQLIRSRIEANITDPESFADQRARQQRGRAMLAEVADRWAEIEEYLQNESE